MIEIFSAVLGFAAPFLPEILKYFNRKQDNAHELEMMKLQIEKGAAEHDLSLYAGALPVCFWHDCKVARP